MAAPFNPLKAALRENRLTLGIWLDAASPVVAEVCGRAGFDWAVIDAEHGPNDLGTILSQLQALAGTPTATVVRVPSADPVWIKRVLDLGVQSLIVPMIHDAQAAAAAVRSMRYPPRGIRGIGSGVARSGQWGGVADYVATSDGEIACILQAESAEAVANVDAIVATEGVDAIFIGPGDLAVDLGHPGRAGHAEVRAAIRHLIRRARAAGKGVGIFDLDPESYAEWIAEGVTMLAPAADMVTLRQALLETAAEAREIAEDQ